MTDIQIIPLNKLTTWDGNVRKTRPENGIDELAASIAAHGLLQSLVVRKAKRGKFAVIAGGRRLMALQALVKDGRIDKDHGIDCRISDDQTDPSEISLAENVVRSAMHPADQFEAFRDLVEGGASVADVAARFGTSESTVAKRLKLGRLSPVILAAYREGTIGLEEAQAYALSDDHAAQERVFEQLSVWQMSPRAIRNALTEGEVPASDKRVRFIGLDTYEAGGGAVRRDLFDAQDGGYVQDSSMLDALVIGKLETIAIDVEAEGWKWVEPRIEADYSVLSSFGRVYPEDVPLADDDQARLNSLSAAYDDLAEQAEADPENADLAEELGRIDAEIDAINEKSRAYSPDALAQAGAIVTLGYDGTVDIRRGLVLPEDVRKAKAAAKQSSGDKPEGIVFSAKLTEELTATKTAIIAAELTEQPDAALAAVVHALTLRVFYDFASEHSCLQIGLNPPRGFEPNSEPASERLVRVRERWGDQLPGNPAELWDWCLEQTRDVLLDLLAFVAANAVDAILRKQDHEDSDRLRHANALVTALQFDIADRFTPTAENVFGRISRDGILTVLSEAEGAAIAPAWTKLKKADLAALAERELSATGWLPAPLQIAGNTEVAATTSDQDDPGALTGAAA